MSNNKITIRSTELIGETLYATAENDAGQYANGTTLEAYNPANLAGYAISLTASGRPGRFIGTMPALAAGWYTVTVYAQLGGAPSEDDDAVGSKRRYWDGTAWVDDALSSELEDIETDVAGLAGKLTTQYISVVNPARQGKVMDLVIGDDYLAADDRAFTWVSESEGVWPDLTGADIAVAFERLPNADPSGVASFELEGDVITPTGANKKVSLDMQAAVSVLMSYGTMAYKYRVKATLASGSITTLSTGTVNATDPATHEEEV